MAAEPGAQGPTAWRLIAICHGKSIHVDDASGLLTFSVSGDVDRRFLEQATSCRHAPATAGRVWGGFREYLGVTDGPRTPRARAGSKQLQQRPGQGMGWTPGVTRVLREGYAAVLKG